MNYQVLLYNFFAESPVSELNWRVVLGAFKDSTQLHVPSFDDRRHLGLQFELKLLYVAVTRARKHVWIIDSSESVQGMQVGNQYSMISVTLSLYLYQKLYWVNRNLIKIHGPDIALPQLAGMYSH